VAHALALVLSGGGGERLSVLTSERAVSAVPFGGKYRIIDFVLSNCCHSGIDQVGVLTQHAPTSLHDHIGAGRPWDLDRRAGGVLILQPYLTRSHAGWYRGTADAIAQNWDLIRDRSPERLLVLSGDHVYRMDYRALLETHVRAGAAATLAVTRVPPDQTRRFGMATVGREGRVTALEEKPERAATPFANMGIYVFDSAVLDEALKGRPVDLVLDILQPMLAAGRRIWAHRFEGYWEDVGTVGSFYRANLDAIGAQPRLELYDPAWPLLTRDEERPPVLVHEGATIEDSLVANGCRVAGTVRRSILFPGVTVEHGARIEDSVVMADSRIGRDARVERSILDKQVAVGAGARIGTGEAPADAALEWLEGITLVGKDAAIPDQTCIGRASVIGIGARPGDFASREIAPGTRTPNHSWFRELV